MSARTVTIADIAIAGGVSVPTVSKVLNGRRGVSAATRRHICTVTFQLVLVVSSVLTMSSHTVGDIRRRPAPSSSTQRYRGRPRRSR